jgi:hypothetical protein
MPLANLRWTAQASSGRGLAQALGFTTSAVFCSRIWKPCWRRVAVDERDGEGCSPLADDGYETLWIFNTEPVGAGRPALRAIQYHSSLGGPANRSRRAEVEIGGQLTITIRLP